MSLPPHVVAIRRQLELASKLQSSYIDPISQVEERLLESLRDSHVAFGEHLRAIGTFSSAQEVLHQSKQHLLDAFENIQSDTIRQIEYLAQVHRTWAQDIRASVDRLTHIETDVRSSLLSSIEQAIVAEQLIARIDLKHIHNELAGQAFLISRALSSFDSLAPRFHDLTLSAERIEDITALPSFVLPSASRELVAAGNALVTLSRDDDRVDEEEQVILPDSQEGASDAQELLYEVDPALARTYQGAKEAIRSGSVDRARHVLASLRELWNHLLRTLAPDNSVLPWATGKGTELTHEGKPTRRARLLYICRKINHEPLSDFLDSDTKAFLEYIQLLNRVHKLEPGLSDQQLNALLMRSDLWLIFTIQVSKEGT